MALYPEAIVSIGGVTTGCPCEDGPSCTARVAVVAADPDQSHGLTLSRIEGQWVVGPLQEWWLEYHALVARMQAALGANRQWYPTNLDLLPWHPHYVEQSFRPEYARLADEQAILLERAPACPDEP